MKSWDEVLTFEPSGTEHLSCFKVGCFCRSRVEQNMNKEICCWPSSYSSISDVPLKVSMYVVWGTLHALYGLSFRKFTFLVVLVRAPKSKRAHETWSYLKGLWSRRRWGAYFLWRKLGASVWDMEQKSTELRGTDDQKWCFRCQKRCRKENTEYIWALTGGV